MLFSNVISSPPPPPASDSEFINVINIDLRGFQQMEWNM